MHARESDWASGIEWQNSRVMQFLSLYIYISLLSLKVSPELGTDSSEEEHRSAEEVADWAQNNMASAMKQDEHSPAPANQVAGPDAQINGQPHHRICLQSSSSRRSLPVAHSFVDILHHFTFSRWRRGLQTIRLRSLLPPCEIWIRQGTGRRW